MSAVADLNDNCFVLATELIAELCEAFEDEIERKPTIHELCEILCEGIRSCATDILEDIHVESLVELKAKVSKRRKVALQPGDVLAVPAAGGGCYWTVYLGLFRIAGDAMGLLSGRHPCRPTASDVQAVPIARPIFFHKEAVSSGRWPVVGRRADWLALFPNPPEYFFAKRYHGDDERVGPYGSAETVRPFTDPPGGDTPLRQLSEAEARETGLLESDFFQSGLAGEVEAYLNRILGADVTRPLSSE